VVFRRHQAFSRYLPSERGLSSRRVQELAEWCSHQAYWHYSKNALDAGALDAELRAILRKEVSPWHVAQIMLVRSTKWCWLRAWAMKIARHRGMKKAIVALARRLAVVMHRIWVDGTDFRWTREVAAA